MIRLDCFWVIELYFLVCVSHMGDNVRKVDKCGIGVERVLSDVFGQI